MKLNLTKLFAIISHIVIAAPVVIAAVKPVIDEMKKGPA